MRWHGVKKLIEGFKMRQTVSSIKGIEIGVVCACIKQNRRDDFVLFQLADFSTCAAVFTQNAFCAAPVVLARQHLAVQNPKYLLINSGNANAGTGKQGFEDAKNCCEYVAQEMGCSATEVLPFSTGVIGQRLPMDKIRESVPKVAIELSEQNWDRAARAIMTTDTVPKIVSTQFKSQGKVAIVTGIAKGSGMIKPNMATMLAFIATDAAIPKNVLQTCLNNAVGQSFNRITVDGDTSTNDACVLIATGKSDVHIDSIQHIDYKYFSQAVSQVCLELAQTIIRDGEGATKFITLIVEQGKSEEECLEVAYTIAHSPLVKTAFFASDANWGRILAAVGRANVADLDIDKIELFLDDVCIVKNGGVAPDYKEIQGQSVMSQSNITVRVVLGRGEHQTQIWTCDLSHDYVKINAEYRT